jgi:hypothetical protein
MNKRVHAKKLRFLPPLLAGISSRFMLHPLHVVCLLFNSLEKVFIDVPTVAQLVWKFCALWNKNSHFRVRKISSLAPP